MKRVFVTWIYCERTNTLSHYLNAEPVFITQPKKFGLIGLALRYRSLMQRTQQELAERNPALVISHNLPPFLVLAVSRFARQRHIPFILDGHSGAFNLTKWKWFLPFYRRIAAKALLCFSTNTIHQSTIQSWGGRSEIISDLPVKVEETWLAEPISAQPTIVIPCSFNADEPIAAVFDAAKLVPQATFKITGNPKKLPESLRQHKPHNVEFTGFVERDEYFKLLSSAWAVMVLTRRNNTMQRGAYEALSLARPIITSDWQILRDSFEQAAVYVNNTPDSIVNAVHRILNESEAFAQRAIEQKNKRKQYFLAQISKVEDLINNYQ